MKKTALLFALATFATLLLTQQAHARIWRVNNRSNYSVEQTLFGENLGGKFDNPVFAQINQAIQYPEIKNADGIEDTIYVEGSMSIYDRAVVDKKVVLIGAGYLMDENPKTSPNQLGTMVGRFNFYEGSEGSQLIGMSIVTLGQNADAIIFVQANDITIKRCRINNTVYLETGLDKVYIYQNFFSNIYNTNALITNGQNGYIAPKEIYFNNNICQKTLLWSGPDFAGYVLTECNNNVFDGPVSSATHLQFQVEQCRNNILKVSSAATVITGTFISHNTGSAPSQFPAGDNNIVVNMGNLFVDPSANTTDGDYQLKPGSAVGHDGVSERGAFGGADLTSRYTLSGLGPIPVIYHLSSQGLNTLQVTIQARTIK